MRTILLIALGCAALSAAVLPATAQADIVINSSQSYDGWVFLYAGSFDPINPNVNLIADNDDGVGGINTSDLAYTGELPGTNYIVVMGAFGTGTGVFTNTISGVLVPGSPIVDSGDSATAPTGTWNHPFGGWTQNYDAFTFTTSAIPEPSSCALLSLSGLCLLVRRRR